jgi:hypothetical protein
VSVPGMAFAVGQTKAVLSGCAMGKDDIHRPEVLHCRRERHGLGDVARESVSTLLAPDRLLLPSDCL